MTFFDQDDASRPVAAAPPAPSASPPRSAPAPTPPTPPQDDDGYDYVDLPAESWVPRWLVALVVVGLLIGAVVGGGRWWYQRQVDPPGAPGTVVTVRVPEGSSTSSIAGILEDENVISSATIFNFWIGGKDVGPFLAGTYRLRRNSSFGEAIEQLDRGPGKPVVAATTKVTIPEGFTVAKILARINKEVPRLAVADLQALLDEGKVPSTLRPDGTASYEGLLYPATYEVEEDTTGLQLLTEMATEMDQRGEEAGLPDAVARIKQGWGLDLSGYDLLVVASLVQAETGNPDESPKIATVIYNRLQDQTALGIDATSKYLAEQKGTAIDLEDPSPYNTRKNAGLPPTPIGSPGAAALTAALQPAPGDWRWYVLAEPGVHAFASTYDEFLAAKDVCAERDLGCG